MSAYTASASGPYTPSPAGTARAPRGFLQINKQNIRLMSLSTTNTSHFTPDTWTAVLNVYNQPDGWDMKKWDSYDPTSVVKVYFGLLQQGQLATEVPTVGNSSLILTGQVDDIVMEAGPPGTITITGRDQTAVLVDTKTANHYLNMTSSEAVTSIAQQFGFTPKVTKTTTPIGKYFNNNYSALTGSIAYWDFIIFLAQQEEFDAYLENGVLYFGPVEADNDPTPWVFYMQADPSGRPTNGNVKTMQLHRSPSISKDITVTVISHDSQNDRTIIASADRAGTYLGASSRSRSAATTQSYVLRKPGLTAQQAQNMANSYLKEISKYEREFTITIEGAPGLSVRKQVIIRNTDTSFDQKFYIRNIVRKWAPGSGFEMTVTGKNIPTENEAQVSGESA